MYAQSGVGTSSYTRTLSSAAARLSPSVSIFSFVQPSASRDCLIICLIGYGFRSTFANSLQKNFHNLRVKMSAALLFDVLTSFLFCPFFSIGAVRYERIPHIDCCKDAREQRNIFPCQPLRIAGAIPFFMMTMGDVEGVILVGNRSQHTPFLMIKKNFAFRLAC